MTKKSAARLKLTDQNVSVPVITKEDVKFEISERIELMKTTIKQQIICAKRIDCVYDLKESLKEWTDEGLFSTIKCARENLIELYEEVEKIINDMTVESFMVDEYEDPFKSLIQDVDFIINQNKSEIEIIEDLWFAYVSFNAVRPIAERAIQIHVKYVEMEKLLSKEEEQVD